MLLLLVLTAPAPTASASVTIAHWPERDQHDPDGQKQNGNLEQGGQNWPHLLRKVLACHEAGDNQRHRQSLPASKADLAHPAPKGNSDVFHRQPNLLKEPPHETNNNPSHCLTPYVFVSFPSFKSLNPSNSLRTRKFITSEKSRINLIFGIPCLLR